MTALRRIGWHRDRDDPDTLLAREWLLTNGLGGYASGTIGGAPTRRYHGMLIAALANPLGRTMMLSQLSETLRLPDGSEYGFGGYERADRLEIFGAQYLREFRLDDGLPVWEYEFASYVIERRLAFANLQNTLYIAYRVLEGAGALQLSLRPTFHFRSHDAPVSTLLGPPYGLAVLGDRYEISAPGLPPVRLIMRAAEHQFVCQVRKETRITYRIEAARGYEADGEQWSLGQFETRLSRDQPAVLEASVESWEDLTALSPEQVALFETERRGRLLSISSTPPEDTIALELVLAADQFVISPHGRIVAATRARARGDELRTVIAGYHWFTDWGRDTMISLEGLALRAGRHVEARWILAMFAQYVRDGLIPNMFPEGSHDGLYHTADATLWFFHAIDRYLVATEDWLTLRALLPTLESIVGRHIDGAPFGIEMDPTDCLLRQGQDGYQLTWMDAKCDGWVVTPRRGKAVEINALWYNALRNLEAWQARERSIAAAQSTRELADRVATAFNQRFWSSARGHLYDVIDGENGDDDALRPNQLLAVSLPNAVLARERWGAVLDIVTRELLTPVGLRSLARSHPDYKPTYHGDLRTRDAAYHQGTVWSWLIGPYVDAYLKVHPERRREARAVLTGLVEHLGEACIGSVSEVFDAEPPFTPRGCIAQAWGVAELLRAWQNTRD
jgi:predicted glycogen debranching enzyme